ncbi:hypothetical protein A2331_02900 [Candidatus Falkowbacteria bacterium RIFOXYB2_FULL_34_18]|uniref:Uncharacterized protein n=1 Tax=Candidatus Falkowbacteria bacterium RIFOXYD2_FULL_34_120 TaxID=1798007 RepID=A0A1F5TME9_9BACT|nr:MAG: hypothetical protein A2331_02900 [Candidatus Falkowbacteria bacterium RIFOXYB2_FULL_34_18]OGF37941.1 MAG: hypothetical protein A2466_06045 [Candidatus Falkowbacteria bacterium RIFOXYC2_FULL_34_220]OGF39659.1 MAG: hypothetical protein A2515_07340 [Candidatus Falkowbacteria bacterium RIFOXYD12_FULL_34_57]OGF40098.1 MAG: hypothetical protein A2531_05035 [Candidatus Falkowbacteria bacterium RIFOXYD2_FULL_34_120]
MSQLVDVCPKCKYEISVCGNMHICDFCGHYCGLRDLIIAIDRYMVKKEIKMLNAKLSCSQKPNPEEKEKIKNKIKNLKKMFKELGHTRYGKLIEKNSTDVS